MTAPRVNGGRGRTRPRSGQTIIGFTEAELGLFLAMLFLGLNLLGRQSSPLSARPQKGSGTDSTLQTDPKLAELVALSRQIDSLQRALRAAFVRDSILSARVAAFERQRDLLRRVPVTVPTVPPAPRGPGTQGALAVERRLAVAALERDSVAARLAALQRQTDSARRLLAQATSVVLEVRGAGRVGSGGVVAGAPPAARGAPPRPAGVAAGTGNGRGNANGSGALVLTVPTPVSSPTTGAASVPGVPVAATPAGGAGASGVGPTPFPAFAGVAAGGGGAGGAGGGAAQGRAGRRGAGRSNQTPSCIELRAARGAIADVQVLARDRYQVGDSVGTVATVLRALAREQRTARRLDCRQRLRIATTTALPVEDFVIAVNALLPYFDTELIRLTP